MSYVAFDLEIKEPVDEKIRTWDDARSGRCGVSVLCCYESESGDYIFFDENSLEDGLDYLSYAPMLVGFNTVEFDLPCLEGAVGRTIQPRLHCDLLRLVWESLGKRQRGFKLADICARTLGSSKFPTDPAPQLYAQKRFGDLYTYCLKDVQLTARLFDFILANGYIVDPLGERLEINLNGKFSSSSS